MGLLNMHYDRPGPGVSPNAPRKKGAARFAEILGRDFGTFYLAGMLALLSALPWMISLWVAIDSHAVLPLLVGGVLGGMIAAPQYVGLHDTVLRAMRDEPGYWWTTYRRAWKRNAKASLLPGAVWGLLLGMQVFAACHIDLGSHVVLSVCMILSVLLLFAVGQYIFAQIALVELPFVPMLKNALLLFVGYLPRSALGMLWQLVFWIAVILLFPVSLILLLIGSLWLPVFLSMMAIYPALDKSFDLEKTINAMREAQLNGEEEKK